MKKYKQVILNISVLTLILSGGLSSAYASSDEYGDSNRKNLGKISSILETFESGDYNLWKEKVSRENELYKNISKEQFDKFILLRELARNGEYSKALVLSKELREDMESIALDIQDGDKAKLYLINDLREKIRNLEFSIKKSI